jgi:hypothetical protein
VPHTRSLPAESLISLTGAWSIPFQRIFLSFLFFPYRSLERSLREAEQAAEAVKQARLEKLIKEAKGRPYTIDDKGNFIIISQVG